MKGGVIMQKGIGLKDRLPQLVTAVPGPVSSSLMKERVSQVPTGVSYGIEVFLKRGEGAMVEDVDGNTFVDFAGGLGVMNIGHSHPEVLQAVSEQLTEFTHTSINVIQYESYVRLAEKLNTLVPGDFDKKTMFVNSGAEANENAIKIARKYTGRKSIVTFTGAFHGRTNMTMALTSKVKPYKLGFDPFPPGIHRAMFPYVYRRPEGVEEKDAVDYYIYKLHNFFKEEVDPEEVAAVIIEPVQGEGGFVPAPLEFVKEVHELCNKHGMLLICDEIQTGFCRTGRMMASEYWADAEVFADITTCAKSLAAGFPLSAVTGRATIMDSVQIGGIGGTYGGNPVGVVAALKVIEIMERDRYDLKAQNIGHRCMQRLEEMKRSNPLIGDVRGVGAMIAIELVKDQMTKEPATHETKALVKKCNQLGMVILDAGIRGNVLRFLMPLNISDAQLDAGLDIIGEAIETIGGR